MKVRLPNSGGAGNMNQMLKAGAKNAGRYG